LANINELSTLLKTEKNLRGFNVTVPYKETIIPYLSEIELLTQKIGSINTVTVERNKDEFYLKGYNTDLLGFSTSLEHWFKLIGHRFPKSALILGNGGAAKAVAVALRNFSIDVKIISRTKSDSTYKTYNQLIADDIIDNPLIINTTPLGMYPNIEGSPPLPYHYLSTKNYLFDLVYNPEQTAFMKEGLKRGAYTTNGLQMLHLQADKAWEIFKNNNDNIL
jgi:shikimate dehydrogenase